MLPYPYVGYIVWWIGIILAIMCPFAIGVRRVARKIDSEKENGLEAAKVSKLRRERDEFVFDGTKRPKKGLV